MKIFGFDLGIASIGWAVINVIDKNKENDFVFDSNSMLLGAGARCFDEAQSATNRRENRTSRRRNRHRAKRMKEIRALLRTNNLIDIPEPDINNHNTFYLNQEQDINVWQLRAVDAFTRKLTPRETGRILYHLAKHRGYDDITYPIPEKKFTNSQNDKEQPDTKTKNEEKAISAIQQNRVLLQEARKTNPDKTMCQIIYEKHPKQMRNYNNGEDACYTNSIPRSEVKTEAKTILEIQKQFGNDFSNTFYRWDNIAFRQRKFNESKSPLYKSIDKMRGRCLFTGDLVAPKESPSAQLFVVLTKCRQNGFNEEQSNKIIAELYNKKTGLKYTDVRKILNLPEDYHFYELNYKSKYDKKNKKWINPEVKDLEKGIFYAFTGYHKLHNFVDNIPDMDKIIEIIAVHKTPDKITEELKKQFDFSCDALEQISKLTTKDFIKLSASALKNIIPGMLQGKTYNEACETCGYDYKTTQNFIDTADVVCDGCLRKIDWQKLGNRITSPVVKRTLSQFRKVYNAMVYKYGKPDEIHLEIGRELKKSERERFLLKREQEANKKINEETYQEYGKNALKYKLYCEQGGKCPYCGKTMIAGQWDLYQIDHILPYSRSLDNSQSNKVLVCIECNQKKGNKIPYEFLSHADFFNMSVWATSLHNPAKLKKLTTENFPNAEDIKNDFINKNAIDNAIIARFATDYLKQGIVWQKPNKINVQVRTGALTDYLRHQWGLEKHRDESDKHHAQDAIVIACSTQSMVTGLSRMSAMFENKSMLIQEKGTAWYNNLKTFIAEPWQGFKINVNNVLESIIVSRPPRGKATGELHNATICGNTKSYNSKKERNIAKNRGKGTTNIRFGKAERGDMFRFDIWKLKNGKYTCIPVFLVDIKAKNDNDFKKENAEFICSLHKDDYVRLITTKDEVFEGYIKQMVNSNVNGVMYPNLVLYKHDNTNIQIVKKSVGSCKEIKKFNVTLLGNLKEVQLPEKRNPVVK